MLQPPMAERPPPPPEPAALKGPAESALGESEHGFDMEMEITSVPWHGANVLRIGAGSASEGLEVYCAPTIPPPDRRPGNDVVAWQLHRRDGSLVEPYWSRREGVLVDAYQPLSLLDTLEAASEHLAESVRDEFPWESPDWRATPFLKAATQDLHRFAAGLKASAGDSGIGGRACGGQRHRLRPRGRSPHGGKWWIRHRPRFP